MDKFEGIIQEAFGVQLADEFRAGAIYYDGMDYVEYTTTNKAVVADRVDEFLTLLLDLDERNLVGFRIKGFKYLFNECLKPLYKLADEDFLPMVTVIEAVIRRLGDQLFEDQARTSAYKKVYKLAQREGATLYDFPMQRAA